MLQAFAIDVPHVKSERAVKLADAHVMFTNFQLTENKYYKVGKWRADQGTQSSDVPLWMFYQRETFNIIRVRAHPTARPRRRWRRPLREATTNILSPLL